MQNAFGAGSAISSRAASAASVALALAALGAGLFLSTHHPVSPAIAAGGFLFCFAAFVRWPSAWLFVLPASLPLASLSPWTGWIAFDEFDLIVMAAFAAGIMHRAFAPAGTTWQAASGPHTRRALQTKRHPALLIAMGLATITSAALIRGLARTESLTFGFYDGYSTPLNSVRAVKAVAYALALLPMLHLELARSRAQAFRTIGFGMLAGIVVVVAAACWERTAYPGAFDFSASYRTVALFWEMHVGGAAIDGYLVMAMPFVVWAVLSAATRVRWAAAASLAVATEYVCMTTYSRGVYAAVCGGLIAYAIARRRGMRRGTPREKLRDERWPRWRRRANLALVVVLIAQGCAIVGSKSFLLGRFQQSRLDLGSRVDHWKSGIALLQSWPDWLLGLGLGRFPADYLGLPVDAQAIADDAGPRLRLHGPRDAERAGLYELTQSLPRWPLDTDVGFEILSGDAVRVAVAICESHLIYRSGCTRGTADVEGTDGRWQRVAVQLQADEPPSTGRLARGSVFSIALLEVDAKADIRNISVGAPGHPNALINGDFSQALAHWFPVAHTYFVPWHIDNLYLEALIEQGIAGLLILSALLTLAFKALATVEARHSASTPPLAAALTGVMLVGMVSNILDVPRVAFLFYLLVFIAIESGSPPKATA